MSNANKLAQTLATGGASSFGSLGKRLIAVAKSLGDDFLRTFIKTYGDDAVRAIAAYGDDTAKLASSNADDDNIDLGKKIFTGDNAILAVTYGAVRYICVEIISFLSNYRLGVL